MDLVLVKDLEENLKVSLKDKKILILGAGGAARGIIPSIIEKNPAKLKIANRTESKALLLKEDLEGKVDLKEKTQYLKLAAFQMTFCWMIPMILLSTQLQFQRKLENP